MPSLSREVARGRRGQEHPRIAERLASSLAFVMHDVVPDEQRVPARLLGLRGDRRNGSRIGEVTEVRDVDRKAQRSGVEDRRTLCMG